MIKCLHHSGIVVSDMDKSLNFYRDLLGLKVKWDFEVACEAFDKLWQNPGTRFRVVYFEEDFEIVQFYSPDNGRPVINESVRFWDSGNVILVFEVPDLEKTYSALTDKGVKFIAPPQEGETLTRIPGSQETTKVTHVIGPDHERISFVQFPRFE